MSFVTFTWIVYNSYKYSKLPDNIESIKLIRKETAPLRVTPTISADDGVQNQDKLIYKNFESKNSTNTEKPLKKDNKEEDRNSKADPKQKKIKSVFDVVE